MSSWTALLWGHGALSATDLLALGLHFAVLSLLAIGGAITTAPDMQRYVVVERGWLTDAQFTASVALAQAAPGPNVLFVAVVGWNIAGLAGVLATLTGSLLPSSLLALAASRFGQQRAQHRGVRAFTGGLAPLTIGLMAATGWVLLEPVAARPAALLLATGAVAWTVFTRASPLWAIAAGAVVGALGGLG